MRNQKLSILFVIKKSKKNKLEQCPLYVRLTYSKKREEFSSRLKIEPKFWIAKSQVSVNPENDDIFNLELDLIRTKIYQEFVKLKLSHTEFTVLTIKEAYFGKPASAKDNVIQHFESFLNRLENLVGKDIKIETYNKYRYSKEFVEDFIYLNYQRKDIEFGVLNLKFIEDFEYYLRTNRGLGYTTIYKIIQRFRKSIRIAQAESLISSDPFMLYKAKVVRKPIVFLSDSELNSLKNYKLKQQRLSYIKDLFVFSCYTGLPYEDLMNLSENNIVVGFDRNLWINIIRAKTNRVLSIPILPEAQRILSNYQNKSQRIFPYISNQKYNSYLKEIADIVGIEKRMTTHMARRTFASTVLLYNNVPIEIVSELLGHSSIKITQESYGKIVQKSVSEEMNRLKKIFGN